MCWSIRLFLLSLLGIIFVAKADDMSESYQITNVRTSSVIKYSPSLFSGLAQPEYSKSVVCKDSVLCDKNKDPNCINTLQGRSDSIIREQVVNGSNIVEATAYSGANDSYVNPNNNSYNHNAVANFNITNANQTTLQTYSPALNTNNNPQNMIIQNAAIPFKPNNSTSVNVGANKVEFNISY